ncbi:MAG: right-handed parallel beta-helix repeat-containing protein [Pirellulales bacterium]|nr:right-handed parallel beta-helix repeat-containing protein [Pirellulales bacterium]
MIQENAPRNSSRFCRFAQESPIRRTSRLLTPIVAAALIVLAAAPAVEIHAEEGLVLHVATDGNDAWSGRLPAPNADKSDGPLATLERARDAIRSRKQAGPLPKGGVAVEMSPGIYELSQPLELVEQDSGTEGSPIIYRARERGTVRLIGGRVVTGWKPVVDSAILARWDEQARDKVLQADLRAQGISRFGQLQAGDRWGASNPDLELFFQDEPMTLARWPNQGYVRIPAVLGPTPVDVRGTKGCREGVFTFEGDRPNRWAGEKDVMLHGHWFWDWADQRLKVESIDTGKRVITLAREPQHAYGFRAGQWYYAYNLLSEIDQPGEWYLDRQAGILYFWPPAAVETGRPMISVLPNLVTMENVSFVTLRGIILEACQGTAVAISGGVNTRLAGCVVRNTGAWAVSLGGSRNGVVGCDLYNLADGGVSVSGGDRKTLTPAALYVDNCHIFRFGRWNPICKPGVQVDGVGNRVSHNLFHDAPHMAIMWGGNDHTFEFNEFHSVVYGANDAGIMYAGYNPAMRGHTIRYNYFHHVYGHEGRGCNGVYLDDMFCSATIFGNIFCQVPRAAFIGGGHDNVVENNIFVDCTPALHVDARMMGWASASVPIMKQRLEEIPYREEPWRSRYPQLLTYLEGDYAQPRGNLVARNICWGGKWDEVEPKARPGVIFADNLVGQDPRFIDPEQLDFRLRDDSPAWKLGFQRIPVEKIGLYPSDDRATWPVRHAVRARPTPPTGGN